MQWPDSATDELTEDILDVTHRVEQLLLQRAAVDQVPQVHRSPSFRVPEHAIAFARAQGLQHCQQLFVLAVNIADEVVRPAFGSESSPQRRSDPER